MCESGGGRPGLPVPNSPYGLCGRKAALEEEEEEPVTFAFIHGSDGRNSMAVDVSKSCFSSAM